MSGFQVARIYWAGLIIMTSKGKACISKAYGTALVENVSIGYSHCHILLEDSHLRNEGTGSKCILS